MREMSFNVTLKSNHFGNSPFGKDEEGGQNAMFYLSNPFFKD